MADRRAPVLGRASRFAGAIVDLVCVAGLSGYWQPGARGNGDNSAPRYILANAMTAPTAFCRALLGSGTYAGSAQHQERAHSHFEALARLSEPSRGGMSLLSESTRHRH